MAFWLILLVVLCTSQWVYFDARSIGVRKGQIPGLGDMSPVGWLVACLLLWIVAFPLYLAKRGRFKRANEKPLMPPVPPPSHEPPRRDVFMRENQAQLLRSQPEVSRYEPEPSFVPLRPETAEPVPSRFEREDRPQTPPRWDTARPDVSRFEEEGRPPTPSHWETARPHLLNLEAEEQSYTSRRGESVRQCPFCSQEIRVESTQCRFCGNEVEPIRATRIERNPVIERPVIGNPIEDVLYRPEAPAAAAPIPASEQTIHRENVGPQRRRIGRIGILGIALFNLALFAGIVLVLGPSRWSGQSDAIKDVSNANAADSRPEPAPKTPNADSSAPTQPPIPTWQTLATWQGSGSAETELFRMKGREWRINWNPGKIGPAGRAMLEINIYNKAGARVAGPFHTAGTDSGSSTISGRPGRYYLSVISLNQKWEISIEEK